MSMKFGIEIEFYSPKNITDTIAALRRKVRGLSISDYGSTGWKIVRDGSLAEIDNFHGMELVSPVLDTDKAANLRVVRKVCAALQAMGSTVNNCCGLHVHVDGTDLSVEQIKTIFHRYTKFEGMIDLMVPANRRGTNVYYTKGGANIINDVENCQTMDALMRVLPDRYYKVNLSAIQRHGTIEFRQHSGSINADTILNWVEFLTSFVEASKTTSAAPQRVVRGRGRPASGTGMAAGCRKVYDVFMASYNNGGGTLYLATIANRTGLAINSVKVAISTLKTKHGIVIKKTAGQQRGATNPMYTIANPHASPRLNPVRSTRSTVSVPATPTDTIWRGVSKTLKAYYVERIQELSGFGVQNVSL